MAAKPNYSSLSNNNYQLTSSYIQSIQISALLHKESLSANLKRALCYKSGASSYSSMKHYTFIFSHKKEFIEQVNKLSPMLNQGEKSVLFQIYSNQIDEQYLLSLSKTARTLVHGANVIGCTTFGEICNGAQYSDTSVASVLVFSSSCVSTFGIEITDNETLTGQQLSKKHLKNVEDLKGVLLFTTPLSINSHNFLNGLASEIPDIPIFGGGAGDYLLLKKTLIINNDEIFCHGAVFATFSGKKLQIEFHHLLGWIPFGHEMQITRADYNVVQEIDHKPAAQLYQHYFDISGDRLLEEALSFPLLLNRNDTVVARVPLFTNDGESLVFLADIHEGEKVRFGFGDINQILEQVAQSASSLREFQPQGIIQFSCGCRRLFFENDIKNEIAPFNDIAPTAGFFTYGELCHESGNANALNAALLLIGMKEVENDVISAPHIHKPIPIPKLSNPNLARIMHFISQVTSELQGVNKELVKMATYDGLTGILNRSAFDKTLEHEVARCQRYEHDAAIILMDVDNFKSVNDNYGHQVGDNILIDVANIIAANIRDCDVFARYGGEEFILLQPETTLVKATEFAERLRILVEKGTQIKQTELMPSVTCSFGVALLSAKQPNPLLTIKLADQALYYAKSTGRNNVKSHPL